MASHPFPLSNTSRCTGLEKAGGTNSLVGIKEIFLVLFPGRSVHHGSKKDLQEAQVREEVHAREIRWGYDLGAVRVHRGRLRLVSSGQKGWVPSHSSTESLREAVGLQRVEINNHVGIKLAAP